MSEGLFGGMFDFDGNGELDSLELASEMAFLHEVVLKDDEEDEDDEEDY